MISEQLSESEKTIVLQSMTLIVDGEYIDDFEFQTRLAVDRDELRQIIARWPELNEVDNFAIAAISNCLNEACHGVEIKALEWRKYFDAPRERVEQVYLKWLRTVYGPDGSGGIR